MSELHTHCQCDNCTGEDCGQDNPEEYEREREEERADIRQAGRENVLDNVLKAILFCPNRYFCTKQIEELRQESKGE